MTRWWNPYSRFVGPGFDGFWSEHLARPRKLLFIVGVGFDPRVLGPLQKIVAAKPNAERHCIAIDFQDGFTADEAAGAFRDVNQTGLNALFPGGSLDVRRLEPNDQDGIRSVSRNTALMLGDVRSFSGYTDIVLDISSLPRIIYLTILNTLLTWLVDKDAEWPLGASTNLHVVYAEAAGIDSRIQKKELEPDLAPIHNLSIRLDEEATEAWPTVWFPVLGEGNAEILARIADHVVPEDVCPVLPAQTADPHRADNIMHEVGEQLFERFEVDPRDILYATEDNPFQLYRSLLGAMQRYEESLALVGGVRFVLSPLSSKGLSVGALLACFEKRLTGNQDQVRAGLAYVETRRYEAGSLSADDHGVPVSLWLAGECYRMD
ncbi:MULTISPECIES: hypothetical protein [Microvirga]|uniref:hypothetical protein n=1 Tax=Microvirga TaxID=186650 RepID=UPI0021C7BB80|nr:MULTISPECIES: hypothetical protein [unclassified Microvirga]